MLSPSESFFAAPFLDGYFLCVCWQGLRTCGVHLESVCLHLGVVCGRVVSVLIFRAGRGGHPNLSVWALRARHCYYLLICAAGFLSNNKGDRHGSTWVNNPAHRSPHSKLFHPRHPLPPTHTPSIQPFGDCRAVWELRCPSASWCIAARALGCDPCAQQQRPSHD